METFVTYFAPIFGGGLYLFMCICGNYLGKGIFYNYYSRACARARSNSVLPQIAGNLLILIAATTFTLMALDYVEVKMSYIIVGVGLSTALGWAAFTGFNFDLTGIEE